MATQYVELDIVACETSAQEIIDLIKDCQLADIGGTANTKYRDYAGEDILEELHDKGYDVQRAKHEEDDGASMIHVMMFVPDEQKERVNQWIADNDCDGVNQGGLQSYIWGVSIGDTVDMPEPDVNTDSWNFEFRGSVVGFRGSFASVQDGDGDVFDIEPRRLKVAE